MLSGDLICLAKERNLIFFVDGGRFGRVLMVGELVDGGKFGIVKYLGFLVMDCGLDSSFLFKVVISGTGSGGCVVGLGLV